MSVEKRQLRNIRNRILEYVKTVPPQKLIELALVFKIKVPDELIKKYSVKE